MDWKSIMGAALATGVLAHGQAAPAAAGEVTVRVASARQSLAQSDDVVVDVTFTNGSATTLYLLEWQTPFGAVAAPLFEVTRDGLPVRYLGIQAKRPAPAPADYVALKPGASRSVRIELSALYDMAVSGAYNVRWRDGVTQLFSRPGVARAATRPADDRSALPLRATAVPAPGAASLWIDGRLPRGSASAVAAVPDGAGLSFSRCSNAQQEAVAGALQAAQAMARDAGLYLQGQGLGKRYGSWFGAADAARSSTVAGHFKAIADAFDSKPLTVDCGCNEPWYAYVYPDQPYRIHLCKAFWRAAPTGTDSRGGTLVHEMSHFGVVAGTDDLAYGQQAAAALARTDPARAIGNADSHEYFGENTPHLALGRE